ncbi:MAG: methyltransferase domain-containing protein [Nocardioidaceae bacterium]
MDARAWDERYAASELVWSATPNQFVASELAGLPPARALDLAAGEGRNALWLADHGWSVTAIDFSLAGLDKGRSLQERHVRGRDLDVDWVHADVLTYETGPTPFDLALLAYLQLPADERRTAVRRAFGALDVGGTFFVIAHDSTNLTEGTGGPQSATVLYTAEEVLADLDGERFEVERAERVERLVTPGDDHRGESARTAYDCLVRVVRTA